MLMVVIVENFIPGHTIDRLILRIFPVPRRLSQSMPHRPEMFRRPHFHAPDSEVLEDSERNTNVEALGLRRTEAHNFELVMSVANRFETTRWCLRHMLKANFPSHFVRLRDKVMCPRS